MKIKDILQEEEWEKSPTGSFQTKKVSVDPETGQVSWDVEYTPLIGLDADLEDAYEEFKKAIRKHPDDEKLEKLFEVFAAFKRQFRSHVTRKYGR